MIEFVIITTALVLSIILTFIASLIMWKYKIKLGLLRKDVNAAKIVDKKYYHLLRLYDFLRISIICLIIVYTVFHIYNIWCF